ncbi:hypothetical protein L4D76_28445, partial [Photobacterium sagamiensis]|uniref:hypothetical protein n=1 Tax=Photobacterium sagamiensis TaxID=2910241 RepID=UPI003D0F8E60
KKDVKLTIDDIKDGKAYQAKEITFVLNELVAIHSMYLQKNFTRIDHKIGGKLSPKAEKLYSTLKMESKITPLEPGLTIQNRGTETFVKVGDLDYWNTYFDVSHKTIRRLIDSFRVHKEITEKTELCVHIEGITLGKGKKYDALRVIYFEQTNINYEALANNVKEAVKPTRKLKRRPPKVPVGSHREGEWARENIKILSNFELELKRVGRKLPAEDVKRMKRYHTIIGQTYTSLS